VSRQGATVFAGALTLGVLLALASAREASAWTDAGHRIVAQIAT
jgi:hypothetical protein